MEEEDGWESDLSLPGLRYHNLRKHRCMPVNPSNKKWPMAQWAENVQRYPFIILDLFLEHI